MKKLISVLIMIIMMLSLTTISMAAEVSVSLSPEKENVEQGTEIKVSLIVNNFTREGTQKAIEAKVEYDNTKIEYKSINWMNSWTGNISTDGTGLTANKSSEVKESEVIAEITYLIKENAEKGKTEIEASQILTSADGDEVEASDAKAEIGIIEAGIDQPSKKLTSIEITKGPDKIVYTEGEKFDISGIIVTAKYSDETSKIITGYGYKLEALGKNDTKIIISYTEDGVTETAEIEITVKEKAAQGKEEGKEDAGKGQTGKNDGTEAGKGMPNAGVKELIIPAIVLAIFGLISYVGYRKNNI